MDAMVHAETRSRAKNSDARNKSSNVSHGMIAVRMLAVWNLKRLSDAKGEDNLVAGVCERVDGLSKERMRARVQPTKKFEDKVGAVDGDSCEDDAPGFSKGVFSKLERWIKVR